MSPSVSVVMPMYNAADTVAAAIASVRAQTFADWELIVVDDGSTDASVAEAVQSAQGDPRIRIDARAHGGIVAALNAGCADARGRVLARMDADDAMHPERLQRQRDLLRRDPRIGLCGARVRMVGAGLGSGRRRYERWMNRLLTHEDMTREILIECPIAHPTFMLPREAFEEVGGYADAPWPEDYDLLLRIVRAGWRLAKTPETLLDWRHRADRLSMNDSRYDEAAFRALKRRHLALTRPEAGRKRYQWGAGEVGKRWLREWPEDQRPEGAVDINPRKIGRVIHGCPVIAADDLPPADEAFIVVVVGAPGARDEIRAWLDPRGYQEARDYLFAA